MSASIERPMQVVLVGAGNLATSLGVAMQKAGHKVVQVFSRTLASATALAERLDAQSVTAIPALRKDADIYVIAVKDSALPKVVEELCGERKDGFFVHTAGSMDMGVFAGHAARYGVLYPMQTFSKERVVDFQDIPCFVEGSGPDEEQLLYDCCLGMSRRVFRLGSEDRRRLHLAAVFACNFVNHCYTISSDVLSACGLPFDVMLPLIDETAAKVHVLPPERAQTGPAVRYDENVLGRQRRLLDDHRLWQDIYDRMSESIHLRQKGTEND